LLRRVDLFQLVSPKTPKFSRAIVQSAAISNYTPSQALIVYSPALRDLNCGQNVVQCLRSASVESIVKAQATVKPVGGSLAQAYRPVLHPEEMPVPFMEAFETGKFQQVPILIGSNLNEASYFLCPRQENLTALEYYAYLGIAFGLDRGRKIAERYPINRFESPKWALSYAMSDYMFKCPALNVARAASKFVPTQLYHFEYLPGFASKCQRVAHAYELPYLFDKFGTLMTRGYQWTRADLDFKVLMKKLWFTFVSGGDNGWSKFDTTRNNYVIMKGQVTESNNFLEGVCDFWRTL
jgi:para-nitrobenzyl esterase